MTEETSNEVSDSDRSDQESSLDVAIVAEAKSSLRMFIVGCMSLGALIGYLVGASNSPVVGAVLPLLFVLIGGASGLHLSKVKVDDRASLVTTRAIGICVGLFSVICLSGVLVGSIVRGDVGLLQVIGNDDSKPGSAVELPEVAHADDYLSLLLLRADAKRMGASDEECVRILKAAGAETKIAGIGNESQKVYHKTAKALSDAAEILKGKIQALQSSLEDAKDEEQAARANQTLSELSQLYIAVKEAAVRIELLQVAIGSKENIQVAELLAIGPLSDHIAAYPSETVVALWGVPDAEALIMDVLALWGQLQGYNLEAVWRSKQNLHEALDRRPNVAENSSGRGLASNDKPAYDDTPIG